MVDIEELKARVNIVDIIEGFVPLKKAGKDYQACCPFHNEKTASFTVIEKDQYYHCFGCGANGDVIDFLNDMNNWDFKQSAKFLGADIRDTELTTGMPVQSRPKKARLPLDKEGYPIDEIRSFLKSCEVKNHNGENIYFKGKGQIAVLTDVNCIPVTLMQVVGQGFKPKPYKKDFIYGSCAVFGNIDGDVYLCENWYTANKLNRVEGKNTVCFFEPLNINFIYSAIKHRNIKMIAMCETEECLFQASRLCLSDCYMGGMKVNLNLIEGYLNV